MSLASIIIIVFLGVVFFSSYGQEALPDRSIYQVSLQLELRNPSGQLVTYLEPTDMSVYDMYGLHKYLDLIPNKKTVTINGDVLELVEFSKSDTFPISHQISNYQLTYNVGQNYVKPLLLFRHDGYFANPGDVLTAHFSIVRTIDR